MSSNFAVSIPSPKAPAELKEIPTPVPNDGEILIKNAAIGLNPIDAKIARLAISSVEYPAILGTSVAGTVQESKNPRFAVGDRVLAYLPRYSAGDNRYGGFQKYSVAANPAIAKIPDNVSFEKVSSYPLNVVIAAGALFNAIGLERPKDWRKPTPKNQTVLIWGGSTSVGGYAVQLAILAGYKVVTTASPHNFDYVKSLGPGISVYDYSSSKTPSAIATHAPFVGILDNAGLPASHKAILEIITLASAPNPPSGTIYSLLRPTVKDSNWPEGVEISHFTYNISAPENSEFAEWIWGDGGFFEQVIEGNGLKETPVEVVGGLEALDKALDRLLAGVSAKKLVVRPE